MDAEQRNDLIQKRGKMLLRVRFDSFIKDFIEPFEEILHELQRLKIVHRIVSLRFVPQELQPLFTEKFQNGAFAKYDLSNVEIGMEDNLILQLMDIFPNRNLSRYVPDLPAITYKGDLPLILQELLSMNNVIEHQAYICWIQSPFLLEIDLQDFAQRTNNEILDYSHDDVIIFPKDYAWLIVYLAFEDEWRYIVP